MAEKTKKTWRINLLPKDNLGSTLADKLLLWATTYGRYIIVLTEFVVILVFLSRFKFDQELTDLHEEISQKRAIIQATKNIEISFVNLQERLGEIKINKKFNDKYLVVLRFLTDNTPQDITLNNLSFNNKNLSLTGSSLSEKSLSRLANAFSTSPYFENVNIGNISINKETGSTGINFSLSANVKLP